MSAGLRRVFHIAPIHAWGDTRGETWELDKAPEWSPPSLASEGFVHLSFAHQLAGTLTAHFADAPPQQLLEISAETISDSLRLEPSRDGALFPHLYRPLRATDVLRWWRLQRDAGSWDVPLLGASPEHDDPLGATFAREG